jgi:hypothetical protein
LNLNIPKKYREGVFRISQLDDRTVQEIRGVLNKAIGPSPEGPGKAAVAALTALSETNKKDFLQISEALVALYGVKAGADVSLDEFVDDVCDAMESIEETPWRVSEEQRGNFRDKLLALLGAEAFTLTAKAQDLQTDDERTFCRARILTDLRPVFGTKIEDGPKGMVIVHLLKLGFHQASVRQHDEFYVALDADDLQTLKKVIERAQSKANVLRSTMSNLPVLGIVKE